MIQVEHNHRMRHNLFNGWGRSQPIQTLEIRIMSHKTYASKASAVRQAKKDHGDNYLDIVSIGENKDGKWQAVMLPKKEVVTDDLDTPNKMEPRYNDAGDPMTPAEIKALADKGAQSPRFRDRSTMSGACSLVWDIAGSMLAANPSVKRKDILEACTERGVAYYTARTQYQKYKEALAASTPVNYK